MDQMLWAEESHLPLGRSSATDEITSIFVSTNAFMPSLTEGTDCWLRGAKKKKIFSRTNTGVFAWPLFYMNSFSPRIVHIPQFTHILMQYRWHVNSCYIFFRWRVGMYLFCDITTIFSWLVVIKRRFRCGKRPPYEAALCFLPPFYGARQEILSVWLVCQITDDCVVLTGLSIVPSLAAPSDYFADFKEAMALVVQIPGNVWRSYLRCSRGREGIGWRAGWMYSREWESERGCGLGVLLIYGGRSQPLGQGLRIGADVHSCGWSDVEEQGIRGREETVTASAQSFWKHVNCQKPRRPRRGYVKLSNTLVGSRNEQPVSTA